MGRGPAPSCFPDREDGTVAATTAAPAAEEDLEKTKRASAGKAKEEACSAWLGLLLLMAVAVNHAPFPFARRVALTGVTLAVSVLVVPNVIKGCGEKLKRRGETSTSCRYCA